jgi:hypothetical protein
MSQVTRKLFVHLAILSLFFAVSITAKAQPGLLSWGAPVMDTSIHVSGQTSRSGVGAAVFNGKIYIAYSDHSTNGNLWLTYQITPSSHSTPVKVPGAVVNNNPALAVYNYRLWVVWVDSASNLYFASTSDGVTFDGNYGGCNAPGTVLDSPSAVAFSSYLVIGYKTTSSTFGLCNVSANNTSNHYTYPTWSVGDGPGLGVVNGNLWVANRDSGSNNYIRLHISPDGINFTYNSDATFNHTSTSPSIVFYNGNAYIGYRQNADACEFYYTYELGGGAPFLGPKILTWSMGGPPNLLVGPDGHLYNIFSQNASSHYLSTAIAQ